MPALNKALKEYDKHETGNDLNAPLLTNSGLPVLADNIPEVPTATVPINVLRKKSLLFDITFLFLMIIQIPSLFLYHAPTTYLLAHRL